MNIIWTIHSQEKMRFYGLSKSRIKRVINNPKRKEIGIAPKTIAVMQPAYWAGRPNSPKHSYEVWAMYQIKNPKSETRNPKQIKIITAWRYPGKSPIRGPIPIPPEILEELGETGQ
jgi:hypothetical protein